MYHIQKSFIHIFYICLPFFSNDYWLWNVDGIFRPGPYRFLYRSSIRLFHYQWKEWSSFCWKNAYNLKRYSLVPPLLIEYNSCAFLYRIFFTSIHSHPLYNTFYHNILLNHFVFRLIYYLILLSYIVLSLKYGAL